MQRIDSRRGGFTLLEVLVSTSVIMIGIFGIAGAIALSEQLVLNSFRADMAANCGRAALETMVTQNWMDQVRGKSNGDIVYYNWMPGQIRGRENRTADDMNGEDFNCSDHIRQNNSGVDLGSNPPQYDISLNGDYTWVGTIRRISTNYCEVSAAVTCRRSTKGTEYISASVSNIRDDFGNVYVQASASSLTDEYLEDIRTGEFVYLTNSSNSSSASQAHWYQISSMYTDGGTIHMTLRGPQWIGGGSGQIFTPGGVIGAYTQIVPMQLRGGESE